MNRNRVTIIWSSSPKTRAFVFSVSSLVVSGLVVLLLLSWMILGVGGYLGIGLYRNYVHMKQQNSDLVSKKRELDELQLTVKRMREDEKIIRSFLGLEWKTGPRVGLGQGGTPTQDFSSVAREERLSDRAVRSLSREDFGSILDEARYLRETLQSLIQSMRERQKLLDSTPSILPVRAGRYRISSGFGWRRSPFTGHREFHEGVDISAPRDTPIIAPSDGRVIKVDYHRYRGKYVQLDHGWGYRTTFAHLSGFNVTMGQGVKRGNIIAYMGDTGRSTGTHLHYEIEINGSVLNPLNLILDAEPGQLMARSAQASLWEHSTVINRPNNKP